MPPSLIIFYVIGIVSTFGISIAVFFLSRRYTWEIPKRMLYLLCGLSAYFFVAQYLKYQNLHTYVDFAHWLEVISNIADAWKPLSLNQEFIVPGTLNYFAAHFVPLVYIFGLAFKWVPSPVTVILLNVLFMLSSAIPLYKLGVLEQDNRRLGLLIGTLLLWYPTFQYITLYEFEMLRFSIPILLWVLYFFEMRRTILFFLFVMLAILVREEVGLTITMFGIYAFFFAKRRVVGVLTMILGLAGFWIITNHVMPSFSTASIYEHVAGGAFLPFGTTFPEIIKGVLAHPVLAIQTIFDPLKLANLFMLGLPFLFVPLLSPSALFGAAANIGTGLLSSSTAHSSYMLYYVAPSIPFIFYALLKAWPRVTTRVSALPLMNALFAGALVSTIIFGPSPLSLQFWFKDIRPAPFRTQGFHWSAYRVTEHHKTVDTFVNMIPTDAIVSAQEMLHPRLYTKQGAMVFPTIESKDGRYHANYIFLDRTNNGLNPESPAYIREEEIKAVVSQNDVWEKIAAEDGYELYRKKL